MNDDAPASMLQLLLFCLLVVFAVVSDALQLVHRWKASPGSILAADMLAVPTTTTTTDDASERRRRPVLATAGHSDGGSVRFWPLPVTTYGSDDGVDSRGSSGLPAGGGVHAGSIFALSSSSSPSSSYLASGSFDRSAALHRVESDSEDDIRLETVGVLPEHTGWVRGVRAVRHLPRDTNNHENSGGLFPIQILSIGCNLINVWTMRPGDGAVVRVARLDAGPSPDDPPEETFRRHDILSIAAVNEVVNDEGKDPASSSAPSWIVAGLVDGTVRAFESKFEEWAERVDGSPYDATGSCDCAVTKIDNSIDDSSAVVRDEAPCCSTVGHAGRVTCVLPIPGTTDFISVGYDGRWIRWRIGREGQEQNDGASLSNLAEGCIPKVNSEVDEDRRILCATIVPDAAATKNDTEGGETNHILYVGINSGRLYRVRLSPESAGECQLVWEENDDSAANDSEAVFPSVTALTHAEQDGDVIVFACRSDGTVVALR